MSDLRARSRLPHIDVTAAVLKNFACATMAFYSVSMSVIQNGMLHMNRISNGELQAMLTGNPEGMLLSGWAVLFQLIGGMAIPVLAFLLVEGFLHTGSYRRYLARLAAFAVISEVPFDFAMSCRAFDPGSQNLLLTLTICLVMLYGLRMFQASKGAQALIVAAALLWGMVLRAQFALCMVLLAAVYYILRDKRGLKLVLGASISLLYVTGPLSALVLRRYEGQPGKTPGKWLYYILYPAHLLVLGAIAWRMG